MNVLHSYAVAHAGRRRLSRWLAALAAAALAGCSSDAVDPVDTPVRASLGVRATLQAQSATAVEVDAGYRRIDDTRVVLASTTAPLVDGAQQARLSLDIRPCLADPERVAATPACLVDLRVRLMRGTVVLDTQTVEVPVRPGEAATAPAVTLYEVQSVRIAAPGIAGGTGGRYTASVTQADTLRLTATPLDAAGQPVGGRAVAWVSTNRAIVSVDAATGLVTGQSLGTAVVQASSGGRQIGEVSVTVTPPRSPARPGALTGRLVDAATGAPIAGAVVRVQPGSVATANGPVLATVTSGAEGAWSTTVLPAGTVSATVTPPAGSAVQGTSITAVAIDGDQDLATIPLAPPQAAAGTVTGRVIDATTGQPVRVPVTLTRIASTYGAVGSASGVDSLAAFAGTHGTVQPGATFSQPTGATATLLARAAGYVDALVYVASTGAPTAAQDIVLSPIGAADVTRIVLTWGDTPRDLDSYVAGPTAAGGRFVVYYGDPGSCTSDPFVCLDVDDTNGFGPETITIGRPQNGTYRYVVRRFSSTGTIAASGARVSVYVGARLIRSFTPPAGDGAYWNVFDLVRGQIVPVNTYGETAPADPALPRALLPALRTTKAPASVETPR